MEGKDGKFTVLVGTIIDDTRVYEVPKRKVVALKFTERARAKIEKAGGECLTFDQLALRGPLGQNTFVLTATGSEVDQVIHLPRKKWICAGLGKLPIFYAVDTLSPD